MMLTWSREIEHGWFTMAEVEINSRCNRKCPYCPNSVLPVSNVPALMKPAVLGRIVDELMRVDFAGRISYHFYGEPLLHPNLLDITSMVTRRLPKVRQIVYTNGDLLTEELHQRLMKSGVARFIVTSHDRKPVPNRINQVVLFPEDLNLTNRGGAVSLSYYVKLKQPLDAPCFAPSSMLIVTITGDILSCYEDAQRTQVMGNIMENSIDEIWFSAKFQSVRERLVHGDRHVTPVCNVCNNISHPNAETYDYRP